MFKHILSTLGLCLGFAVAAQAQTTAPNTPVGNHTAGTTNNPVDPTSKVGQSVSGATGQGSRNATPDDRNSPSRAAGTAPNTPTGNHTAGTTANPVDPTSNMSTTNTTRSMDKTAQKTSKTKVRTSN